MFTFYFFWSRIHIILAWLESFTFKKIWVILKSYISYVREQKHSAIVPSVLTINLTYKCNYKCIMCQKSSLDKNIYNVNPRDIDLDEFKKLIDNYGKYLSVVKLHGGEPLFYKDFQKIIKILDEAKLKYTIITNGALLTPDICSLILKNCLLVSVSLDTVDADLYSKIRKGGNLVNVQENILNLIELKKKYKKKAPYINICVTAFKFNIAGLKDVVKYCADRDIPTISVNEGWFYNTPYLSDDDFIVNHPVLVRNSVKEALALAKKNKIKIRLNSAVLRQNEALQNSDLNKSKKEKCFNFYISAVITPELDFKLCPMSEPVGNLQKTPLEVLWNSDNGPMVKARMGFKDATLPETCRYCLRFNEEFDQKEKHFSYVNFQKNSRYWKIENKDS